ncbi:MAG: Cell division GTPase FtsZ family [Candidatus Methanohalarchaeum thermophilum]|uniref:Cell division protein FtsZ n=1 Tax=Methanohalarchaeum thermophilum TaxID=1903181 RepID=A0A1Q6DXE7_METT1|nr:MAG: Cell division GTPase FtsZ family [Candidatus Methanohalarchaeum thermophilum]
MEDMDSLIKGALEHSKDENEFRDNDLGDFEEFGKPNIMVCGCGGAGNNTINRLHRIGIEGAETIAINTDKQHLDMINADKRILVGKSLTNGLGAGGYPDTGKRAAELARGTLEEVLSGTDLVFVTAGMGGGTGTGVAPVISEIAKEQGAIVVGMVSTPFHVERARLKKAEKGLEKLKNEADTVIVLDNNRLLDYVPDLPIEQAFSVMDQLIAETVKGLSETITQPSLINLDYADVKAIMSCGGVAVMLIGETSDQNKSGSVVREALNHPLLDVDYEGATGCLVHITGGSDLTLKESENIAKELTYDLSSDSNVIWGARINDEYEGKVRVMAIMTGVRSAQVVGDKNKMTSASSNLKQGKKPDIDMIR